MKYQFLSTYGVYLPEPFSVNILWLLSWEMYSDSTGFSCDFQHAREKLPSIPLGKVTPMVKGSLYKGADGEGWVVVGTQGRGQGFLVCYIAS